MVLNFSIIACHRYIIGCSCCTDCAKEAIFQTQSFYYGGRGLGGEVGVCLSKKPVPFLSSHYHSLLLSGCKHTVYNVHYGSTYLKTFLRTIVKLWQGFIEKQMAQPHCLTDPLRMRRSVVPGLFTIKNPKRAGIHLC